MRQASGVQLSTSTGMSVLSKRPVSGGKDQVSVRGFVILTILLTYDAYAMTSLLNIGSI